MIKKKKMIKVINATSEFICDGCGTKLWSPKMRGKQVEARMWEAFYCGAENDLNNLEGKQIPDDVHLCYDCFDEAMRYIRGKKEEERNNNLKNQTKTRKRFCSPGGNNSW